VNTALYTGWINLKHVQFWLNDEQYEKLKREAEKHGLTPYAYLKQLVLKRKRMILLGYFFMFYSAVATLALLLLIFSPL